MSLHLNPEYDKLLPRMTDEEFTALKVSIEQEGQHYPIIVNEDLEVLDGHHRFRACTELGIEPDFEVRKFEDKLLEKKFVIEANLRRRHLNNFQLVELAVPLLEIEKALAKKRQSVGGKIGRNIQLGVAPNDAEPEVDFTPVFKAKATEVVAKKAGVSTRTFERGKKILETASEDDKQKLREGKLSIAKAYQEIVNAQKPPAPEPTAERLLEPPSARDLANQTELAALLERLSRHEVFCPECKNAMFECTKCHKPLNTTVPKKPPELDPDK
jgi:ParB-like chromosome segregation protein Spo0J